MAIVTTVRKDRDMDIVTHKDMATVIRREAEDGAQKVAFSLGSLNL